LEYDPKEYHGLIAPILDGRADVVYGQDSSEDRTGAILLHSLGNKFLTLLSNMFTNLNLTIWRPVTKFLKKPHLTE